MVGGEKDSSLRDHSNGQKEPRFTIIIPTYKRADILRACLICIVGQKYPLNLVEVRIYDNGAPHHSRAVATPFEDSLKVTYAVNEPGHGLGFSLRKGAAEAKGMFVVEMNDDAIVPPDFLQRVDELFSSNPEIGVVGVRAIEANYVREQGGIGQIDTVKGAVIGNFDQPTTELQEVEHVYGFCYAYRRELLERGGRHDDVLLTQDYSSGERVETDHCLTARRLGYRVVYDGRIAVQHLAKPRGDYNERSLKWKLNHTRNTLYLFLKHFGPFGKRALSLRYTFLMDVGLISLVKRPSSENLAYFVNGLKARASAFWHYFCYLGRRRKTARINKFPQRVQA